MLSHALTKYFRVFYAYHRVYTMIGFFHLRSIVEMIKPPVPSAPVRACIVFAGPIPSELTAVTLMTYMV